ncbi:MAG: DUF3501 family protein [Betaproteobacteria bacterium]
MASINRATLMTLEAYANARHEFRARVIAHKKARAVHLGDHVTLLFEDELTMRYQVQEMLRIERIFEAEAIDDELSSYNPLVPDGSNLKATMLVEYEDAAERKVALAAMKGIEDGVWIGVDGLGRVAAIADEDMERENADKTSSVHFLRFEFTPAMIASLRRGAPMSVGVEHPYYRAQAVLDDAARAALVADFA